MRPEHIQQSEVLGAGNEVGAGSDPAAYGQLW
jgi:hypothetical protein